MPFMTAENRIKLGFGLCIAGLAIAALSLIPAIVAPNELPWPIFAGSIVYFPGSILVFFSSRGADRKKHYNAVRFVRLGFVGVIVLLTIRLFSN